MKIEWVKADKLKQKPADEAKLGFGKLFTDYMFTMKYSADKQWHDAKIEPYAAFSMDPSTMVLHYGQEIFEGLKAYKAEDGRTLLFRPEKNFERMNRSAQRLCMPVLDVDFVLSALKQLLKVEEGWIPRSEGTSLYIRPTMLGVQPALGVHASPVYLFYIILCPVGAYYPEGLKPVKIYVEDFYVRAAVGGLGEVKTGGNYAASLLAGQKAEEKGYTQVLWLDAKYNEYIEEVGSMNIFFKINGTLITPPLNGSILPGITRDSVLKLADEMGIKTEQRPLSIKEVFAAAKDGMLEEVFGTGTAAVISPVGELTWKDKSVIINNGKMGNVARGLYDRLVGIQYGKQQGPAGWSVTVE
ncbi:MAG: branched-chain amino acid aminotransferase [Christensenellales bacterium]